MLKVIAISLLVLAIQAEEGCSSDGCGLALAFTVVSDTNTRVAGPDVTGFVYAVPTWVHPAWTANIPGATWIWDAAKVTAPTTAQTSYFERQFFIPGAPIKVTMDLGCDNSVWTIINGEDAGCNKEGNSFQSGTQFSCDITPFVFKGLNTVDFRVLNAPGGGSYDANPAGLLFKISVKYLERHQSN